MENYLKKAEKHYFSINKEKLTEKKVDNNEFNYFNKKEISNKNKIMCAVRPHIEKEKEYNIDNNKETNENENEKLKSKIRYLETKMRELNEELEKKRTDNKKLKEENESLKSMPKKNDEMSAKINKYKEVIQKLKDENTNIKNDSEFKKKEKENLSKDPLEFYDIIGNINSMQNVNTEGWDFYMNENGFNITQSKGEERLVIGVIGNRNKGKSFILQAFSGASLKTGTTINTIGISIKFVENKFVLLDCAGSESPLLGEYANMLEISRDKLFTEAFLENYILRKSNALLLVVGILSFSEQKLINKIIQNLSKLNEKEKKNLIVIHNLQTYEEISDVERYIEETLLKSASFKIKKQQNSFAEESEFFYDIDNDYVKHFIFAKENSRAGEKYNQKTIDSIKSIYVTSTSKYNYDFKETIMEHFKYMSDKMFDGNKPLELAEINEKEGLMKDYKQKRNKNEIPNNILNDDNKLIDKNEFNLIDKKFVKNICKLKYTGEEKLSLQKLVIDELGISSFINNDFTTNYEMYYNDKELIINIECPDGMKVTLKRKKNRGTNKEYPYCIEISAEKEEEPKIEGVTYIQNRQYGKFHKLIPFSNSNYSLGKIEEDKNPKNGWKSFKVPLNQIEDDD